MPDSEMLDNRIPVSPKKWGSLKRKIKDRYGVSDVKAGFWLTAKYRKERKGAD